MIQKNTILVGIKDLADFDFELEGRRLSKIMCI